MKCECCKNEIKEGKTICSVCGMTLLTGDDINPTVKASVIEDIRQKYLKDTTLLLKTYEYEISDGKVTENGTKIIRLFDALQLKNDVVKMLSHDFEEVVSSRDFALEIIVRKNGKDTTHQLKFKPTKEISHKRIGVQLTPGFRCRIYVGSGDNFIASDEISLI